MRKAAMKHRFGYLAAPVVVLLACASASGQCPMEWASGFGIRGVDGAVYAMALFDDGHGPALYVGGSFSVAGDVYTPNIARWDGLRWSAGEWSLTATVYALCVYDDGNGPALYAGTGWYGLQKWDGAVWTPVPGSPTRNIFALAVFDDDGDGPHRPGLYLGGDFNQYYPQLGRAIIRWDGTSWTPLGDGMFDPNFQPEVLALAVYDDGTGPALYAGGHFVRAGTVTAYNIARWNGTDWSAIEYGVDDDVMALAVYDPPGDDGPGLYAGGWFNYAGYATTDYVARWDGQHWSALGLGPGLDWPVYALCAVEDQQASALYVGGEFSQAGGQPAKGIARWDGNAWSCPNGGLDGFRGPVVRTLLPADLPGAGEPRLYVGGFFDVAGGVAANHVTGWDGTAFFALGSGNGVSGPVYALTTFDAGSGPAVYAGGEFAAAGPAATLGIARWDGNTWSAVGGGLNAPAYAFTTFDDGTGPALYVGGAFNYAGDVEAWNVAKWDGAGWSALGSGVTGGEVYALAVYDDDGPGPHQPALYAAGWFTQAGGAPANRIGRWNGTSWSALGSGLGGGNDPRVWALAAYDDGTGPALYAGGAFTNAGGVPANYIAKWNGASWSAVGGGMGGGYDPTVRSSAVFDDGSGPALYAAGGFARAGGTAITGIARWNGVSWSPVGTGVVGGAGALTVFDEGHGLSLFATAGFVLPPGQPVACIGRWDGTQWNLVGAGMDQVYAMTGLRQEGVPSLFVGMNGVLADGRVSVRFAQWTCMQSSAADTNCDGVVNEYDIDPFILALVDRAAYEQAYPGCDITRADCNADGAVNAFDIDPFIELLGGK